MRLVLLLAGALVLGMSAPVAGGAQAEDAGSAVALQAPSGAPDATTQEYPVEAPAQSEAAASSGLPQRAPQARTLRAHWHVYVAFAITWLLLFGYALSLGRRFGRLDEEVQRLKRTSS